MKNLFAVLVLFLLPLSAMAHARSHEHYGFIAFAKHFFTQPDHLLFMALAIMVICLWRSSIPNLVRRCIFLVRK
jgi:hydrogenase/urease accessory protein HupE